METSYVSDLPKVALFSMQRILVMKNQMNGQPWIEYWKTITGLHVPDICPFCGKSLNEGDAEGCHVVIAKDIEVSLNSKGQDVIRPLYIIPGHHDCNCQFGKMMQIKNPVVAVIAYSPKTDEKK